VTGLDRTGQDRTGLKRPALQWKDGKGALMFVYPSVAYTLHSFRKKAGWGEGGGEVNPLSFVITLRQTLVYGVTS
jgi:hypothetical protein